MSKYALSGRRKYIINEGSIIEYSYTTPAQPEPLQYIANTQLSQYAYNITLA